jgi:cell wall-associated NlpC family hydrolase
MMRLGCLTSTARVLGLLLLAGSPLLTACASRGPAVPHPFPTPGGDRDAGRGGRGPTGAPAEDTDPDDPAAIQAIDPSTISPALLTPSPLMQSLLSTAIHFVGTPYRFGGADPSAGFDCSGFVYYVFAQQGVWVPRTVADQADAGTRIKRHRDVRPGDLLFFRTSGRGPTHVGIALGPDRFVHAPNSRGEVRIEPLARRYWSERFLEARRVF